MSDALRSIVHPLDCSSYSRDGKRKSTAEVNYSKKTGDGPDVHQSPFVEKLGMLRLSPTFSFAVLSNGESKANMLKYCASGDYGKDAL